MNELPMCSAAGCSNEADPRWFVYWEGKAYPACDGCGGEQLDEPPMLVVHTPADMNADVPAMLDQIATLRADLAASQAEVERCRGLIEATVAHEWSDEGEVDSWGAEAHTASIRYLASIGRVEIVSEQGRRVVARWKP